MNYRLTLQYDGTDFHGWQMQGRLRTVQGELTRALSLIEGREVTVHGAGRTDRGVHAEAQVANVELFRDISPDRLRAAVNCNVARDLRVTAAAIVPDDFHARFSARGKTYRYRIFNAPFISPFWSRYAHQEARRIETSFMREASRLLIGRHDWTAFSSAQIDVNTRVRNLTRLEVAERWDSRGRGRLIEITVSADGFLRYMVRSLAGTLLAAGRGEIDGRRITEALATGERALAGPTAPARGLTLIEVHYREDDAFA